MNIANNILKNSLKNVYFLAGPAMAGKTTMSGAFKEKYGFIHFNDNWHEDSFQIWTSLIDEKYQKKAFARGKLSNEEYFDRTVEEFLADDDYMGYNEYLEFAIIELVKLSQNNKVVADVGFPLDLLVEISDYNRIACLLVTPCLVTCETYGKREDHREFLDCILTLKDPEKKIAVQDELFRIGSEKAIEEAEKYNLFSITRTENSTIEKTLKLLEEHFQLI